MDEQTGQAGGQSSVEALMGMASLLRPAAIRAAATLRIADHIAAGTRMPDELARAVDSDPEVTVRLLRFLAAIGVLRRADDGGFELTELGQPLRSDAPLSVQAHLSCEGPVGHGEMGLVNLVHSVRTGEPCHASVFGRHYWECINDDPVFVPAMRDSVPTEIAWDAHLVVEEYDWGGVERVIDLGGSNGTLLIALMRAHPHLRGAVLELGNTAEVAAQRFEQEGLADRCEALVGDFFKEIPGGADVYLLSGVLADWNDDQSIALLRNCAEAAGPEGKVLVADINLPLFGDGEPSEHLTGVDLYIAASVDHPTRTIDEVKKLGEAAGMHVTWEGPVTHVRSLLEFSPTTA